MGEECLAALAVAAVEYLPGSGPDSLTAESSVDVEPYLCCHSGLGKQYSLERWSITLKDTEGNRSRCSGRHYAWPGTRTPK